VSPDHGHLILPGQAADCSSRWYKPTHDEETAPASSYPRPAGSRATKAAKTPLRLQDDCGGWSVIKVGLLPGYAMLCLSPIVDPEQNRTLPTPWEIVWHFVPRLPE
jgi:hypothetical protein